MSSGNKRKLVPLSTIIWYSTYATTIASGCYQTWAIRTPIDIILIVIYKHCHSYILRSTYLPLMMNYFCSDRTKHPVIHIDYRSGSKSHSTMATCLEAIGLELVTVKSHHRVLSWGLTFCEDGIKWLDMLAIINKLCCRAQRYSDPLSPTNIHVILHGISNMVA